METDVGPWDFLNGPGNKGVANLVQKSIVRLIRSMEYCTLRLELSQEHHIGSHKGDGSGTL